MITRIARPASLPAAQSDGRAKAPSEISVPSTTISLNSGPPAWALYSKQLLQPKQPFHFPPNLQVLEEFQLAEEMRIATAVSLAEAAFHDEPPGLSGAAPANMPRRIL